MLVFFGGGEVVGVYVLEGSKRGLYRAASCGMNPEP